MSLAYDNGGGFSLFSVPSGAEAEADFNRSYSIPDAVIKSLFVGASAFLGARYVLGYNQHYTKTIVGRVLRLDHAVGYAGIAASLAADVSYYAWKGVFGAHLRVLDTWRTMAIGAGALAAVGYFSMDDAWDLWNKGNRRESLAALAGLGAASELVGSAADFAAVRFGLLPQF